MAVPVSMLWPASPVRATRAPPPAIAYRCVTTAGAINEATLTLNECTDVKCKATKERTLAKGTLAGFCSAAAMYDHGDIVVTHGEGTKLVLSTCAKGAKDCVDTPVAGEDGTCRTLKLSGGNPVMASGSASGVRVVRCKNKACTGPVSAVAIDATLLLGFLSRPDMAIQKNGNQLI